MSKTIKKKKEVKKQKFNDNVNTLNDEQAEIKKFIIILSTIVGLIIIIFLFTKYVINDGDITLPLTGTATGQINHNITSVGTMLTEVEDEYFVAVYDATDIEAVHYAAIMSDYMALEGAYSVYFCDLDNKLNENYIATDETPENIYAKSINELSFGKISLVRVKNGQIAEYYNSVDQIKSVLGV